MSPDRRMAVVAVGGNALILGPGKESIRDQAAAATVTCRYVADMVEQGWTVVLTHGNGPQVGFILRRSGIAKGQVPEVPVDYADADTQGAIGYMFQRALYNEFKRRGVSRNVVALVTQVRVAPRRPGASSARPSRSARTWTRTLRRPGASSSAGPWRKTRARLAARDRLAQAAGDRRAATPSASW